MFPWVRRARSLPLVCSSAAFHYENVAHHHVVVSGVCCNEVNARATHKRTFDTERERDTLEYPATPGNVVIVVFTETRVSARHRGEEENTQTLNAERAGRL